MAVAPNQLDPDDEPDDDLDNEALAGHDDFREPDTEPDDADDRIDFPERYGYI